MHIIGRPELACDPRFSTPKSRVALENERALLEIIEEWSGDRTADEILAAVEEYTSKRGGPGAAVVTGRVNRPLETLSEEHWRERGCFLRARDPVYGELLLASPAAAQRLGGKAWVVKAQIHAGGRGKGGGVKFAKTPEEAREYAKQILGMTLVTHQTGPQGKKVKRVLVEQAGKIKRELYLGMVIDRGFSRVVMMASTEGGMEIETVAAKTPEKILKEWVDPAVGLMPFQARKLAFGLGIPGELTGKAVKFMTGLYKAFVDTDCSLAEINPLVVTKAGEDQSPVYAFLGESGNLPAWNFGKYVVDKNGKVVAFFPSRVTPDAPELRAAIEKALGQ